MGTSGYSTGHWIRYAIASSLAGLCGCLSPGSVELLEVASQSDATVGPYSGADVPVTLGNCSSKRIVIAPGGDNGRYLNGNSFSYSPGDTLVLESGPTWTYFSIVGFHGTSNCPVFITNSGGQVSMINGFSISDSEYVVVNGSGNTGATYGFHIEDAAAKSGVGVDIFGKSRRVEVHHVEITNKTYGFWVKNEASCDTSLNYPNWVLDGISIHDTKITQVGQSGMYLGSTSPNGERSITCGGVTLLPVPTRLGNFKIYGNIVDHTNRSGIQLSGADFGPNEIYGNTLTNIGYELNFSQGYGIILGGYSNGYLHDNVVRNTFNSGITSFGAGAIRIESNTVDGSGTLDGKTYGGMASLLVDTRRTSPEVPTNFRIRGNTVGTSSDVNVRVYDSQGTIDGPNYLCDQPGSRNIASSVSYSTSCP